MSTNTKKKDENHNPLLILIANAGSSVANPRVEKKDLGGGLSAAGAPAALCRDIFSQYFSKQKREVYCLEQICIPITAKELQAITKTAYVNSGICAPSAAPTSSRGAAA